MVGGRTSSKVSSIAGPHFGCGGLPSLGLWGRFLDSHDLAELMPRPIGLLRTSNDACSEEFGRKGRCFVG